jgi:hypothetical protein
MTKNRTASLSIARSCKEVRTEYSGSANVVLAIKKLVARVAVAATDAAVVATTATAGFFYADCRRERTAARRA